MARFYDSTPSWIPSTSAHCDMPETDVVKSVSDVGSPMPEPMGYGIDKIDRQISSDSSAIRGTMKK